MQAGKPYHIWQHRLNLIFINERRLDTRKGWNPHRPTANCLRYCTTQMPGQICSSWKGAPLSRVNRERLEHMTEKNTFIAPLQKTTKPLREKRPRSLKGGSLCVKIRLCSDEPRTGSERNVQTLRHSPLVSVSREIEDKHWRRSLVSRQPGFSS